VSASGQISRRSDRRFWSAALGLVLLGKRLYQRSGEDESIKGGRLPKGGIGKQASTKARAAWLEIARLLYAAIGQHRVVSIAAGVTFFVLLAIFPATGALVSVYGLFADPTTIQAHLNDMSSFLPGGAIEIIGDQLHRVASEGKTALGATFLFTLALSLWSANAGMKALFDALNIVYGANESRGLVKLNAVSLGFTVGAVLVLILALGAIVLLPVALQYVGLSGVGDWILQLLRWPALYFVVVLALAFIYRFGPDRERAQWHWITWGSAIAALLWIIASILFSWYAANFGSYNKTYGSLGAAIGFMTWIWISSMVILGGAEIDAVMERLDRGTAK
jgi:membrane protein